MPANAQPVPYRMTAASLPSGAAGFTLTFGAYAEPSFIGMTVKVRLSEPMVHLSTGDMVEMFWTATVGADGTATVGPLPYNDDPDLYPIPTGYYAEWQALSYKPTPRNKAFVVLRSAGPVVDYDLIGTPGGQIPAVDTIALVGSAFVGTATVG